MTKTQQAAHQQRLINNYTNLLNNVLMRLRSGVTGNELQRLEKQRTRYEVKLMKLYGTEQYGLVQ